MQSHPASSSSSLSIYHSNNQIIAEIACDSTSCDVFPFADDTHHYHHHLITNLFFLKFSCLDAGFIERMELPSIECQLNAIATYENEERLFVFIARTLVAYWLEQEVNLEPLAMLIATPQSPAAIHVGYLAELLYPLNPTASATQVLEILSPDMNVVTPTYQDGDNNDSFARHFNYVVPAAHIEIIAVLSPYIKENSAFSGIYFQLLNSYLKQSEYKFNFGELLKNKLSDADISQYFLYVYVGQVIKKNNLTNLLKHRMKVDSFDKMKKFYRNELVNPVSDIPVPFNAVAIAPPFLLDNKIIPNELFKNIFTFMERSDAASFAEAFKLEELHFIHLIEDWSFETYKKDHPLIKLIISDSLNFPPKSFFNELKAELNRHTALLVDLYYIKILCQEYEVNSQVIKQVLAKMNLQHEVEKLFLTITDLLVAKWQGNAVYVAQNLTLLVDLFSKVPNYFSFPLGYMGELLQPLFPADIAEQIIEKVLPGFRTKPRSAFHFRETIGGINCIASVITYVSGASNLFFIHQDLINKTASEDDYAYRLQEKLSDADVVQYFWDVYCGKADNKVFIHKLLAPRFNVSPAIFERLAEYYDPNMAPLFWQFFSDKMTPKITNLVLQAFLRVIHESLNSQLDFIAGLLFIIQFISDPEEMKSSVMPYITRLRSHIVEVLKSGGGGYWPSLVKLFKLMPKEQNGEDLKLIINLLCQESRDINEICDFNLPFHQLTEQRAKECIVLLFEKMNSENTLSVAIAAYLLSTVPSFVTDPHFMIIQWVDILEKMDYSVVLLFRKAISNWQSSLSEAAVFEIGSQIDKRIELIPNKKIYGLFVKSELTAYFSFENFIVSRCIMGSPHLLLRGFDDLLVDLSFAKANAILMSENSSTLNFVNPRKLALLIVKFFANQPHPLVPTIESINTFMIELADLLYHTHTEHSEELLKDSRVKNFLQQLLQIKLDHNKSSSCANSSTPLVSQLIANKLPENTWVAASPGASFWQRTNKRSLVTECDRIIKRLKR